MKETRDRMAKIDEECAAIDRDPGTLRRSYLMFDANARKSGGRFNYYESTTAFADMVSRVKELGITDIGVYFPMLDAQMPMFEKIATETIPELRRQ